MTLNLKETPFESDNKEYEKAWKDKKTWKILHKDTEQVIKDLERYQIEKVICFDQIDKDWKKWGRQEQMTLCILPICNIVKDADNATKSYIENALGQEIEEGMYPIGIRTNELNKSDYFTVYFPAKNLILTKINVYWNKEIYERFLYELKSHSIQKRTKEEAETLILESIWKTRLTNRLRNLKENINSLQTDITNYGKYIREATVRLREEKKELQLVTQYKEVKLEKIKTELAKAKKMPIIKNIDIQEGIYIDFGDIYINEKVTTGYKKDEDGTRYPIRENKKVYIGNIKITIDGEKILVHNDHKVENEEGEYSEHPHAQYRICLGEATPQAMENLAKFDICKLITLLYSWATSYNEEDIYASIQLFWDQNGEGPKKEEKVEVKN